MAEWISALLKIYSTYEKSMAKCQVDSTRMQGNVGIMSGLDALFGLRTCCRTFVLYRSHAWIRLLHLRDE